MKNLTQFLQENKSGYTEEYDLLTGENVPPFIKNSLEIKEITSGAYFIYHDFPVREHLKRCYYLSISGEKIPLEDLENIISGYNYQIMANVNLGERNFSDGRNFYGAMAGNIKFYENFESFKVVEINQNNINLLDEIIKEDEEFYSQIGTVIDIDDFKVCALLCDNDAAAYVGFNPQSLRPTIYTAKKFRCKNLAYTLLSYCVKNYFSADTYITYGTEISNTASNFLAEKLGFDLIRTAYFYMNYKGV